MGFLSKLWDNHIRRTRVFRAVTKDYAFLLDQCMADNRDLTEQNINLRKTIHDKEAALAGLLWSQDRKPVSAEEYRELLDRCETLTREIAELESRNICLQNRVNELEYPKTITTTFPSLYPTDEPVRARKVKTKKTVGKTKTGKNPGRKKLPAPRPTATKANRRRR